MWPPPHRWYMCKLPSARLTPCSCYTVDAVILYTAKRINYKNNLPLLSKYMRTHPKNINQLITALHNNDNNVRYVLLWNENGASNKKKKNRVFGILNSSDQQNAEQRIAGEIPFSFLSCQTLLVSSPSLPRPPPPPEEWNLISCNYSYTRNEWDTQSVKNKKKKKWRREEVWRNSDKRNAPKWQLANKKTEKKNLCFRRRRR